ncbi:MAG: hypothetical protein K6V97_04000 [Actinomycetia bacterium]|nr:hypothetical protein [Actinomycetes bacterium]
MRARADRLCTRCGAPFAPRTANQQYCSAPCKRAAQRAAERRAKARARGITTRDEELAATVPDVKPCGYCGQLMTRPATMERSLWAARRYCSPHCRAAGKAARLQAVAAGTTTEAGGLPTSPFGWGAWLGRRLCRELGRAPTWDAGQWRDCVRGLVEAVTAWGL